MEYERRRKAALNPFSPWKSNAETLHRTIVGRDYTIKDILEKTHRFCNGAPPKHCLLVGRRGMGKTHLLSLVYHLYEKNCILPGFETIADDVFSALLLEEERFSLSSLVNLLMKVFEKLHEKAPGQETWKIPAHLRADEDVIEYCFDNFKNISKSENKKIILLCDNLEDIFKQWKGKEYKILRAFLSDQQAVMILGTAIKIFKEIISPEEPFYEFFEIVPLSDLSDTQMLEMLKRRFIEDGLEEEFNKKEKYLKDKVAAIAKLTGGNPRLVVFLYDIVTKKNVFEVEDATNELMESLSEYFRNRFSDLAPQQRTILDAFAEMDGPATPKEISNKTRIKPQSTHAHIKALKDVGFLEPVEFAKHKITRYDVTERLFRLWRQNATISGRKKYKMFIKFLKLYYTRDEIKEDFHHSIKQLDTDEKDLGKAADYLKEMEKTINDQIKDNEEYLHFKSEYLILSCQFEEAISWTEKRLKKDPGNWDARVSHLINKACLGEFGNHMEGLAGKLIKEVQGELQITEVIRFTYRIMEACLAKGDFQPANGLFLAILKLKDWHKLDEVQNSIALYLRRLVDLKNRELFVNAVNSAREHITDQNLLELLKAFLYAGKYLEEGNKVILEEVFPEIREIILDIIGKLENANLH